jgi:hypothetical protein
MLFLVEVEDRRPIARSSVVSLAVQRRRVVDLKEELEQLSIGRLLGVEDDLDRFGVRPMVAVRGVLDVTARVTNPRRDNTGSLPEEVLHSPEAATGEDGLVNGCAHERHSLRREDKHFHRSLYSVELRRPS